MKDLTTSVKLALKDLYATADKKWPADLAGKTSTLGAKDNCVGLPTAETSWRLTKFTVAEYEKLFDDVKNGTITISNSSDKNVKPEVSITVDYQD